MTAFGHLSIILLYLHIAAAALVDINTLRFVHVLWRHGDRNPADGPFPTDTHNPEWTWPQGFGELTKTGMKQQYLLGNYLRERYVKTGFLSSDYNSSEVYIRSTSYNRTIMSALSNLAGMYPVQPSSSWENNMPWQPVPVHCIERNDDPLLWMDRPCPAVDKINEDVWQSKEVKQIEEANADFLKMLKEKTGFRRMILNDVWSVFDPLNCEKIYNDTHDWPSWVNDSIFEKITELYDLSTVYYYNDPRVQRLRGGMLFGEIASRMEQKSKNVPELKPLGLKYYAYSAHDTTIAALLSNMDAYSGRAPPYAAAVIFELHEKQPNKFTVEVWYLNQTDKFDKPVRILIKNCDQNSQECPLDTFASIAKDHTPDDWYQECGLNKTVTSEGQNAKMIAIVLGILAGVFFLLLVAASGYYCRRRKIAPHSINS